MFLGRSIRRSKWESLIDSQPDGIPADAVTDDLKTQGNTLSFWKCGKAEISDINDVVLAISACREKLEKVEMVWIDHQELESSGQELIHSIGVTPVQDLVNQHIDVCRLDYRRLGGLAQQIFSSITAERYTTVTRAGVKKLLAAAVRQGRLRTDDLKERVQSEIKGLLDSL